MRLTMGRKGWLSLLMLAQIGTMAHAQGSDAQGRDVLVRAHGVVPENLASATDGTLYIASYGDGGIYRALPGQTEAKLWIAPTDPRIKRTMGLWVDEGRQELWVCIAGARKTETTAEQPGTIELLDLRSGAHKASYALENGGLCNDMTRAADGTLYVTDTAGRILRLAPGETLVRVWAEDEKLAGADGIAILADGNVYVNGYHNGHLMRVHVAADGSAGAIQRLGLDRELVNPDGMRQVGPDTILLAEGAGRLTELTIQGDAARARTIKGEIIGDPAGVTIVKGTAYVALADWTAHRDRTKDKGIFRILAVPYPAK